MKIVNLEVYQESMKLADEIYFIVKSWDEFERNTIGRQIVSSSDSIAANISEGYGRYHFKENKLFCYYSRGSLMETLTWLEKANKRQLISTSDYNKIKLNLEVLNKRLNAYINSIGLTGSYNEKTLK